MSLRKHLLSLFPCTLVIIMTVIIIIRVSMRFFFNFTPSWSEELTGLLMVWVTLLGMAIGIRDRSHLSMSLVYDHLPRKVTRIIDIINDLLILFFAGFVMLCSGFDMVKMVLPSRMASVPVSNASLYIMMPLSGILSVIFIFLHLIYVIGKHKNEFSKKVLV